MFKAIAHTRNVAQLEMSSHIHTPHSHTHTPHSHTHTPHSHTHTTHTHTTHTLTQAAKAGRQGMDWQGKGTNAFH